MPKANDKDAYFFSHDCNARNDPKILALRSVYGPEGYGIYFMLIEIFREQPDYKLPITKYIWNTLAMQMQVEASTLQKVVDDCCTEFADGNGNPLLVNDGQFLFSASLLRRMEKMDEIGALRSEAAKKRWENKACKVSDESEECKIDASASDLHSKSFLKEKKRNEMKIKENKGKEDIFAAFAGDDADLLSALQGFEEMRKKIKKPMTDQAKKRMLTELEKLSMDRDTQIAILHQSEDKCWAGVFALKETGYQQQRTTSRQQASSTDKMDALRDLHDAFSGGDSQ